ncbi:DUF489 family protein [Salinisphaera sp.]|uniref:DUF489 family protein n=1 Tax=Salinisphaera sp. TaxID=1914330 RepID=UPI002D79D5BB|nr:DUF489 family protein [Salinisphaera sp.]HET7314073.1 DUF489 family protein [Salinisphaera sp.]
MTQQNPKNPIFENQALALAGVAQFTLYAHELATDGRDLPARFNSAAQAIFCTDPDHAIDVYGSRSGVADGTRYLRVQLSGRRPDAKGAAVARYIGQILKLSGKVLGDEQALGRIRGAIDRARLAEAEDVADIFDAAYRETISSMRPQIMLRGEPTYLKNEFIQRRIRTQLLAAVRCGVMWRQCGGGFVSLFFRRKALLAALG